MGVVWGFPGGTSVVKNPPASAADMRCGFDPWIGKIPWRRAWQPIPVFLPGESNDRGAWWATGHGMAESDMMSDFHFISDSQFEK